LAQNTERLYFTHTGRTPPPVIPLLLNFVCRFPS